MVISWSFLRAFEKCPFQQKLIRIDKVGPKRIDERRFITGTVGHRFFEIWAKRGFNDRFDSTASGQILDDVIRGKYIKWHDDSDYGRVRERVIKEASLLIESARYHGIDKINNLQTEVYLKKDLPDGQNSIAGIIDVIANNGTWIIELKMSADIKWADPSQLMFYRAFLSSIHQKDPIRLSFFLPLMHKREDQLFDINIDRDKCLEINDRIQNVIESLNRGYYPATGDLETCKYCTVKFYCKDRKPLPVLSTTAKRIAKIWQTNAIKFPRHR